VQQQQEEEEEQEQQHLEEELEVEGAPAASPEPPADPDAAATSNAGDGQSSPTPGGLCAAASHLSTSAHRTGANHCWCEGPTTPGDANLVMCRASWWHSSSSCGQCKPQAQGRGAWRCCKQMHHPGG
jgi:hypothetical protein